MSYISYSNQNAVRSQPLDPRMAQALAYLEDMGITMDVYSGGQHAKGSGQPRVGSTRHDGGLAADAHLMRGDERLDWRNPEHEPIFREFVQRGRQAGLTGFGAGEGYMGPAIHVGYGTPAVWGAEGKGENAAPWLREAYYGTEASGTPLQYSQAALGDDQAQEEDPSPFRQWYNRTDDKLRGALGLPDRPELTDENRADRMGQSQMMIQNGLRMMNGGFGYG